MALECQQINYGIIEFYQWIWVSSLNGSALVSYDHTNFVAHVRPQNHRNIVWKSNLCLRAGSLPTSLHSVPGWLVLQCPSQGKGFA